MLNAGDGIRRIARAISQSADVIRNMYKDPGSYGTKKGSGRPPKLSARDKRETIRRMFVECFEPYHPRVATSAKSQTEAGTESQEGRQGSSSLLCPWKCGSQMEWGNILLYMHIHVKCISVCEMNVYVHAFGSSSAMTKSSILMDLRKEPCFFSKRNFWGGNYMVWGCVLVAGNIATGHYYCTYG
jgi:hypothetical protein